MHISYSGQVQGVGFRFTVKATASGYDVTGVVRNLPNGHVELIAEGDRKELEDFRQGIRDAGMDHFIRNEQVTWQQATNEFRGFAIAS